jgi:imidazolonepropionase-like amidohydrolase
MLDVRSGKYLQNQGILTEAGKIKETGPYEQVEAHAPKEAVRIDLSRATMLPGLIDCHAHLLSSMEGSFDGGQNITIAIAESSQALRALMGANNAREALEAGITSARIVGHSGIDGDVALRDAINFGWIPGPRLQASARKITPPGGQAVYLQAGISQKILEQEFLQVSGPEEARKAVRENLALGADMDQDCGGCGSRAGLEVSLPRPRGRQSDRRGRAPAWPEGRGSRQRQDGDSDGHRCRSRLRGAR